MRRLDLDLLARQHLQAGGCTVQTVAFWHNVSVDGQPAEKK
jgi:hypothetical protein